jgi:hypothetical protein
MIFKLLLLILTSVVFIACQKTEVENTSLPFTATSPTVKPVSDSPIRKIDFKNFTFPWTEGLTSEDEKTFIIKNGGRKVKKDDMGVSLSKVEYGDVTGDSDEEAILVFSVQTGGSAVPNMVHIYKIENKKPKMLWNFDTGDRAEGGFKKACAENGNLVVETFGDNKFEDDKWSFNLPKEGAGGLCCPTAFTKIVFKWNGEKFVPFGERQVFDYDWKKDQQSSKIDN